jgi:hypothetical protein
MMLAASCPGLHYSKLHTSDGLVLDLGVNVPHLYLIAYYWTL